MGKVIKDLLLALLNATLILIALCLFLAWQIAQSAEVMVDRAAQAVERVAPVQAELESLRAEVAGLRSDLDDVRSTAGAQADAAAERLQTRIDELEQTLATAQARLAELRALPATFALPEDARGQAVLRMIATYLQPVLAEALETPPAQGQD